MVYERTESLAADTSAHVERMNAMPVFSQAAEKPFRHSRTLMACTSWTARSVWLSGLSGPSG